MYVEYDSNNSGGSWWLEDADWRRLEEAGWVVAWASLDNLYTDEGNYVRDERGIPVLVPKGQGNSRLAAFNKQDTDGTYRYLGAIAMRAYKPNCSSLRQAADEWEQITGQSATDAGCPCCGQPHTFTLYDDEGKYVESGPQSSYEARW
jgi:hypothetical protein